jgi:hypothetical protein
MIEKPIARAMHIREVGQSTCCFVPTVCFRRPNTKALFSIRSYRFSFFKTDSHLIVIKSVKDTLSAQNNFTTANLLEASTAESSASRSLRQGDPESTTGRIFSGVLRDPKTCTTASARASGRAKQMNTR